MERTLFTIGFTKKSAEAFFTALADRRIDLLLDVRLNNRSQLAGFTRAGDLPYFLLRLCGADYRHEPLLAPTQELLEGYREGDVSWEAYTAEYLRLMETRRAEDLFRAATEGYARVCLLCSEPTPERCHRRLLAEYLIDHLEPMPLLHL